MAEAEQQLRSEILGVLDGVAHTVCSGKFSELKPFWDLSDDNPIYIAEEEDSIMTSWSEVEAYWKVTEDWNTQSNFVYSKRHIKRVDDNYAIATFEMHYDLKLNDRPNAIGGDNRAVVSFRKVAGEWKIYSWVEAPLAAITYVRKLYEMNVSDGFPKNKK